MSLIHPDTDMSSSSPQLLTGNKDIGQTQMTAKAAAIVQNWVCRTM